MKKIKYDLNDILNILYKIVIVVYIFMMVVYYFRGSIDNYLIYLFVLAFDLFILFKIKLDFGAKNGDYSYRGNIFKHITIVSLWILTICVQNSITIALSNIVYILVVYIINSNINIE